MSAVRASSGASQPGGTSGVSFGSVSVAQSALLQRLTTWVEPPNRAAAWQNTAVELPLDRPTSTISSGLKPSATLYHGAHCAGVKSYAAPIAAISVRRNAAS